jgi:hypothetical protein
MSLIDEQKTWRTLIGMLAQDVKVNCIVKILK